MTQKRKSITIIGGGIAGLTAAIALAKCSKFVDIQIFERSDAPTEEGAGLQLSPNVTHILRKLGLLDELLAVAGRPENIIMASGMNGRKIADIPLGDFAEKRYDAPYLVVHRADLHQILLNAMKGFGNVELSFGQDIDQISGDADFYIGADGVWSKTKAAMGFSKRNPSVFSGHIAWRALIDDDEMLQKYKSSTRVWLGKKSHVVLYPIRNGEKLNLVAFTEGELKQKSWVQEANKAKLTAELSDWCDDVKALVAAGNNMKIWPLFAGEPEYQTAKDNILLIGDAAHPTLPYQAQGAAMAIEDAACLANLLYTGAETWHEWDEKILPLKLRIFEQSRHDRVTKTQMAAAQNAKIFHHTL